MSIILPWQLKKMGLYSSGLDSRLDPGLDLFVFACCFSFSRIDKINVFANILFFSVIVVNSSNNNAARELPPL